MQLGKKMSEKNARLRKVLLKHADNVKTNYRVEWLEQKPLAKQNANKFMLGAIIDYRIKAELAWDNAKRLSEEILGNPASLWDCIKKSYSKDEWDAKWHEFRIHRFRAAHNRIWRIGDEIVKNYSGDARNIWQEKEPSTVLANLESMRCGPEISRMIVGMLITYKHLDGLGDVKSDIHVCRVFGRIFDRDLGAVEARQLAREIYPDNPWKLDIALYDIGKEYCLSDWCYCENCPIGTDDNLCEDYRKYKANQPNDSI